MRSLLKALWLVLLSAGAAHAQHGFWQPDERVLITSFHNARGIASDQRLVFVATTNGLEIYDQTFKRWLPASTIEDGYPAREGPARIAYDARERGIWLLTDAQLLYTWSPAFPRWQQRFGTELPDDVRRRLLRGPDDRDPAWGVMRNFAGRDAAARTWQVTAIEPAERSGTFWASTYGGNFAFVDTRNLSAEPYTYGTISRGISALARDSAGRLYFGGDGASARNGITRTDTTLQQWQQFESRIAEGPQRRVTRLLAAGDRVYAASTDGVFRLRGARWQRIAEADARALAHMSGRTWVGTRGTLGWFDADDRYHRVEFPVQTVHDLAVRNDTLWIAAQSGLYTLSSDRLEQLPTPYEVLGIALTSNAVIALTARGVQTWDGANLSLPLRNGALQQIGRAMSVSAHSHRIWVGGSGGLAEWNTARDVWRYLTVPNDIPEGPIYDVLEENGRIWLATPAGALRLEWP